MEEQGIKTAVLPLNGMSSRRISFPLIHGAVIKIERRTADGNDAFSRKAEFLVSVCSLFRVIGSLQWRAKGFREVTKAVGGVQPAAETPVIGQMHVSSSLKSKIMRPKMCVESGIVKDSVKPHSDMTLNILMSVKHNNSKHIVAKRAQQLLKDIHFNYSPL